MPAAGVEDFGKANCKRQQGNDDKIIIEGKRRRLRCKNAKLI